jgi:diacylglycerol kinase family enzyme
MNTSGKYALPPCTVVINPLRKPGKVKKLKCLLRTMGFSRVIESNSRNHFITSVEDFYSSDDPYLLVWGGDGTIHDAVNTVMELKSADREAKEKAIGFLRGGSGNGYHDSYAVPHRLKRQLESIFESMRSGYTVKVDILKVETNDSRFYGQLAGFGFDAGVLRRRNEMNFSSGEGKKVRPGLLNYVYSALIAFSRDFSPSAVSAHLELFDGQHVMKTRKVNIDEKFKILKKNVRCPLVEIGKRPYYGNRFKICPEAVCNNGSMEVCIFNISSKFKAIFNLLRLWRGAHHSINRKYDGGDIPRIERFIAKKLILRCAASLPCHVDGELKWVKNKNLSGCFLTVSVVPRALSFLVPANFYRRVKGR